MNSNGHDPHLTAKIVSKYVAHHNVATHQLSDLINTIHQAIAQLGQPVEPEETLTPAVSVRRSVQRDYVVCLECGYRGQTLRRHINVRHGQGPDQYRQRWGLKNDHPLTAPAYSERRSTMSKALGLGRKASVPVPAAAPAPAEQKSAATPEPRRRNRRAATAADVAKSEAAEPSTPARRGRPRSRARVASQP